MGIFKARILEWAAMPSSRGSSTPRARTRVFLHCWWILCHLSYQGSPHSCAYQKLVKLGKRTGGGPLVATLPLTAPGCGRDNQVFGFFRTRGGRLCGKVSLWVGTIGGLHLGSLWELWTKKTCERGCSLDGRLAGLDGL